jgi:hypothetical protein
MDAHLLENNSTPENTPKFPKTYLETIAYTKFYNFDISGFYDIPLSFLIGGTRLLLWQTV